MIKIPVSVTALLCAVIMLAACQRSTQAASAAESEATGSAQTDTGPGTAAASGSSFFQRETESAKDAASAEIRALTEEAPSSETTPEKEQTVMKMNVQIGTDTFAATLEDNEAVRELVEMLQAGPVTIPMSDYAGFEKVGPLGQNLTASNSQTTTTAGDIVLYNGDNIVMFYGSNSWSYTRIGKIDDLTGWTAALGCGDITAVFTLAE